MKLILSVLPFFIAAGLLVAYFPSGKTYLLHLSWMVIILYLLVLIASKPIPPEEFGTLILIGFEEHNQNDKQPISAREYDRGLQEFGAWLLDLCNSDRGNINLEMDSGEVWKPSELLKELSYETEAGVKNLEAYIFFNRSSWKEHYSADEWEKGKNFILSAFSNESQERLDQVIPCLCGKHNTSIRDIIESVKNETDEAERWITGGIKRSRM